MPSTILETRGQGDAISRKAAFSLITVLLVQTVAFGQVDDPWLGIWQAVFVDGNTGATLSSTVTITFGNGTYCWSIPNSTYVPCGSAAGNQMIVTAVAPGGFLVTVYSTLSGDTITGTLAQRRPSDGFIVDTSTITLTRLPVNLNFSSLAIFMWERVRLPITRRQLRFPGAATRLQWHLRLRLGIGKL